MDNHDSGMEKLLTIEKSIKGMLDLHQVVVELKEMEIKQQKIIEVLEVKAIKYWTYLENIPLRLFIKNRELIYIFCNPVYADDLNKPPDEIIGKTDFDLFPFDLAKKFKGVDEKVLEAGEVENIEERFPGKGQEVLVHMIKAPLKDEQGTIIGLMGLFWDITKEKEKEEEALRHRAQIEGLLADRTDALEMTSQRLQEEISGRSRAEETLRQTEEIRQTVFEETGIALVLLSTDNMIIVQANKKLEEVLGLHRKELENRKSMMEFIAEGSLKEIKDQYLAIRSGLIGTGNGREYRFIDQKGTGKDILMTMALIAGTEFVVASLLDVSERNYMEHALYQAEERHRWLIEKAPVAIGIIQHGVFKFINPKFSEVFGYSQKELASCSVLELINTDDRKMDQLLFKDSHQGGFPNVFFMRFNHKDGTIRWVEDSVDLIQWEGSPATLNFFQDVTLRKQAEDELLDSIKPFNTIIEKVKKIVTKP